MPSCLPSLLCLHRVSPPPGGGCRELSRAGEGRGQAELSHPPGSWTTWSCLFSWCRFPPASPPPPRGYKGPFSPHRLSSLAALRLQPSSNDFSVGNYKQERQPGTHGTFPRRFCTLRSHLSPSLPPRPPSHSLSPPSQSHQRPRRGETGHSGCPGRPPQSLPNKARSVPSSPSEKFALFPREVRGGSPRLRAHTHTFIKLAKPP